MGRTSLAFAPSDPQSRGEAVERGLGFRYARTIKTTTIDPLAEFGLGGADLGDQNHRIGQGLQSAHPLLACFVNAGMGKGSSGRDGCRVVALDHPRPDPGLVPQLERGLEQVGVQAGGGVKPGQSLRRGNPLQSAVADQAAHNRAVLLFDPSLIVLAVRA
jgi:hypothetical protein